MLLCVVFASLALPKATASDSRHTLEHLAPADRSLEALSGSEGMLAIHTKDRHIGFETGYSCPSKIVGQGRLTTLAVVVRPDLDDDVSVRFVHVQGDEERSRAQPAEYDDGAKIVVRPEPWPAGGLRVLLILSKLSEDGNGHEDLVVACEPSSGGRYVKLVFKADRTSGGKPALKVTVKGRVRWEASLQALAAGEDPVARPRSILRRFSERVRPSLGHRSYLVEGPARSYTSSAGAVAAHLPPHVTFSARPCSSRPPPPPPAVHATPRPARAARQRSTGLGRLEWRRWPQPTRRAVVADDQLRTGGNWSGEPPTSRNRRGGRRPDQSERDRRDPFWIAPPGDDVDGAPPKYVA